MDEKTIRIEAYERMKKELMHRFEEAFTDGFCVVLENNVNMVVEALKEREQG